MREYDFLIVFVSRVANSSSAQILIDLDAFRAFDITHWTDDDLDGWKNASDGHRAGIMEGLDEADMIGVFHHLSLGDIF